MSSSTAGTLNSANVSNRKQKENTIKLQIHYYFQLFRLESPTKQTVDKEHCVPWTRRSQREKSFADNVTIRGKISADNKRLEPGFEIGDTLQYLSCTLLSHHSNDLEKELHIFQQQAGIQRSYRETKYEDEQRRQEYEILFNSLFLNHFEGTCESVNSKGAKK